MQVSELLWKIDREITRRAEELLVGLKPPDAAPGEIPSQTHRTCQKGRVTVTDSRGGGLI